VTRNKFTLLSPLRDCQETADQGHATAAEPQHGSACSLFCARQAAGTPFRSSGTLMACTSGAGRSVWLSGYLVIWSIWSIWLVSFTQTN